ncbi:MAG TPA: D-alanyl-D-alanine carboxypeptidase/D-alanyl-D-alanine-endopeptidase [Longimicrobium sp.]|uniref:D-alanyl-D-alanine carboxypeptidase/D-alanyl-D-alanine endopeptidase n=1 Tax=Longimicrobium sp. TaxID=2029185 RepID=UPI002ED7B0D4
MPLLVRRLGAVLLALAAAAPLPAQPAGGNVAIIAAPRAPSLAERIDAVLARPQLRGSRWGIEVRDAGTGRVLYARDAARPMIPASNLKLVVTAAAAHHLPADYRFRTSLYATGPVRDGTLRGDLVLFGRGDPLISGRYFASRTAVWEMLADSLRARGIQRIAGAVVADESWWDTEYVRPDWDAADQLWWYAAPVNALGFADNAIDFRIVPGAVGRPARITGEPRSASWSLRNESRTVGAGGARTLDFDRLPGSNHVRAFGTYPADGGADTESFAVQEPARWTGTAFREALVRRGIVVGREDVRVVSDPAQSVVRGMTPLAEWRSPELPRAIAPILLSSQNWIAESLAKTLGREVRGEGSWSAGLAVERAFLTGVVGVDSADFVLRDASGLSAQNRITPRALVNLLAYVRRTPGQGIVRVALPVSGRAGSLLHRLEDLPGRVAAKTGYIGGVDSLSGFVTLPDGREVIFAIIANESREPSARIKAGIDDVVRAIAAGA